jgi:hypothetical protein
LFSYSLDGHDNSRGKPVRAGLAATTMLSFESTVQKNAVEGVGRDLDREVLNLRRFVLTSAQSLANESNRLKLEMGKFLTTVRAA